MGVQPNAPTPTGDGLCVKETFNLGASVYHTNSDPGDRDIRWMNAGFSVSINRRYQNVADRKATGATYTPRILADFVADQIVARLKARSPSLLPSPLKILDPAVGDGELLLSLIERLSTQTQAELEIYGFETDARALAVTRSRIARMVPTVTCHLTSGNFLELVAHQLEHSTSDARQTFDIIIANPPYVRTQIMGATQAQAIAHQFGLSGRIDLYYAFILGIATVLQPQGIAGIITSNRFMTVRAGAAIRKAILHHFQLRHVWDLGDTKLFPAAVLPAVLLVEGAQTDHLELAAFTSIYEAADRVTTDDRSPPRTPNPITALAHEGLIQTGDGRCFVVNQGRLNGATTAGGVWAIATATVEQWLQTVAGHTWGQFRDIGKIHVGVKTCADRVFIRADWHSLPGMAPPELLRPVTTHAIARRFRALETTQPQQILYPHTIINGKRTAVDLAHYPQTHRYLEQHRPQLERRHYLIQSGRQWYELWVSHDPLVWSLPKLVFRDIAVKPIFWLDFSGAVVNGDCYWLTCQESEQLDLLWLAIAVANSTFIEQFYDYRFPNKLYSGRRRFITQYVEQFPLPNPHTPLGQTMIKQAQVIYNTIPSATTDLLQQELDAMVWQAFGFSS